MTDMTIADYGFSGAATEASATPLSDGYVMEFRGLPFNVHPTATPAEWVALTAAIATGAVEAKAWAAPTILLDDARGRRAAEVDAACAAEITGGFTSSALGAAHLYPNKRTDQSNLFANVLASLLPGLPSKWTALQPCADAAGEWAYRAHTAAQIQQLAQDARAATAAALAKKAALDTQIADAPDAAAIAAIGW